MAVLTVSTIDYDGLDVESLYVAAAADQEFANDGRTFMHIKNGAGAPMTCTITTAGTYLGLAIADPVITIGATTGEQMVGPFPKGIYNASDGNIDITWSSTTTVTVAVFKLP
ncbi:MAG: hypothetical protein WBC22_06530 [Sedimentisphaerales bacterium]